MSTVPAYLQSADKASRWQFTAIKKLSVWYSMSPEQTYGSWVGQELQGKPCVPDKLVLDAYICSYSVFWTKLR